MARRMKRKNEDITLPQVSDNKRTKLFQSKETESGGRETMVAIKRNMTTEINSQAIQIHVLSHKGATTPQKKERSETCT